VEIGMLKSGLRNLLLAGFASVALAACGGGGDSFTPGTSGDPPGGGTTNNAPVIGGSPVTTATAGTAWSFQPTASDSDGNALTFSATGLPAWASINAQSGLVSGTPQESDVGTTAGIVVTVSDGQATASLPAFQIAIASGVTTPPPPPPPPSNTAPVISGSPATTVQATSAYSFTPAASDAEHQPLTFSITNKPAWASFSSSNGRLSGTPTGQQVGTYAGIVISVSDGSLSSSLPAFTITVTAAPNRAPTINGTPSTSVTAGSSYSFQPTASDPDGQTLSFSIQNKPSWASFNTSNGRLSGTPADSDASKTTTGIVITVSDGSLSASLSAFAITVNARPNNPPTISGTPATSAIDGENYSFTPAANDQDGDTLTFAIQHKPAGFNFSSTTGALTGLAATGTYANIIISVSDGRGGTASLPAFTLTVTGSSPTGSATLSWDAPTQYTDGTPMSATDLAGYHVYHGMSASNLNDVIMVDGATTLSYVVNNLVAGTHYFAVSAVTVTGAESALSNVGSKTIQ
jgi:Putative Ig domain